MRLTTLILIATMLQVSAASLAQKLTYVHKDVSLIQLFKVIKDQTGFNVVWYEGDLDAGQTINANFKDTPLGDVMDQVFKEQPISYSINKQNIIIKKKAPSLLEKLINHLSNMDVHGRVVDEKGEPLSGATVKVKGTDIGTVTNEHGDFVLQGIDKSAILIIKYVGYESMEIVAKENSGIIKLILSIGKLSEVVVSTGYQTLSKERTTGSFSQPIKEEYDARISTDVLSKLAGIISGLVVNTNTSLSRTGLDINIRGRSTIFANDQPLIVVDNFPYSGDINNINPNDVENVTILKDAASASIWGVRAGNGVIVITTKNGKVNQSLKVGFNANLTVFSKPNLYYNPNQLNASSYIDLEQFLFSKGYYDNNLNNTSSYPVISPVVELLASNRAGSLSNTDLTTQLNALRGLNVNDQLSRYFYQKATSQQYAINLSGGSDKATYYFSSGYDQDLPSAKDNSYQRITLNSQNVFHPIKNLELSAGVNTVQTNVKIDNTLNQISNNIAPYTQFANANGNSLTIPYGYRQSYIQNAPSKGFLDWSYSPLNELGATDNVTKGLDIRLTTGVKYTVIDGLSAEIKYQYQRNNTQNRNYQSQQTYYTRNLINGYSIVDASTGKVSGYNLPLGGILGLSNNTTVSNNVRGQINYNYSWKDHSISAIAGYELSQVTAESNQSILYGYNDELATFTDINSIAYFPNNPSGYSSIYSGLGIGSTIIRLRSSFANAAYTYKDRYSLSASARIDGSNYFGVTTNQKSVPLWSAGAKWDIGKEDFYKLDWLPVLALRASFGYNGNVDQSITGVTTFQYRSNAQ